MTIRRGEPWGDAAVCPTDLKVVASDSDLREWVVWHRSRGQSIADVGVAGLWRLMQRVDDIRRGDAVIVVAGMDAALVSVVAGLVPQPVIGVPTSIGYGVASGGQTALNAMLASCAQGVLVTNIDNGFGAACAAARLINRMRAARG